MENPEDPQIQYGLARQNRLLGELFFPGWDLDAEAAVPFFEAEQAVLEKLSVADDPLSQRRMAESHEHLADALRAVHNLPAALEECQAALSIRKLLATAALSSENEDPTHTLKLLALAHGRVAGAAVAVDNKLEAQQHARLAVDIWEEWKGKFMAIHPTSDPLEYEGRSMIGAYMQAGRIFWDAGETTEARQFFKSMIQLFNSRLAISNNIADFDLLNEYCEAVEKAGILDDVRQQFTKLVELAERRAANQELDVYQREELARPYKAFGDFEFRQMEFDHAIALYEKGVTYAGPDGGGSYGCRAADFYASLAKTHVAKGDDLSDFVKSFNSKRPEGLYTRSELACTLAKDGHWEAVAELIHDWESFDDPQGWGPLQLASCCVTLFCMQEDAASAGSKNDAAPDTHYLERAIAGFRKALATAENAEKDPQLRDSYLHWIVNQRDLAHSPRSCALSEPLIRDCVAAFEKQHPGAIIGNPRSLLATVLLGQQKYAEAERLLLDTFRALLAAQISNLDQQLDRETGLCATLKDLIRLYSETGKLDEVAKWRIESEKLYLKRMHEKIWLSYYPGREWYVQNLVDLYTSWNKPAEAAKWQKRR